MLRRSLAVMSLALFATTSSAQIPQAPGSAGAAPRDEEPGRAHPVLPPGSAAATPAPDAGEAGKPTAAEIVDTMNQSRAAAKAEATPTSKPMSRAKRKGKATPRPSATPGAAN